MLSKRRLLESAGIWLLDSKERNPGPLNGQEATPLRLPSSQFGPHWLQDLPLAEVGRIRELLPPPDTPDFRTYESAILPVETAGVVSPLPPARDQTPAPALLSPSNTILR